MNQNIAPPAQISIQDRIKIIEAFLEEQEKALEPAPKPILEPEPQAPEDMITLLKKITENQEIDRKRYERSNPVENDDPIYDWAEETINPGDMVQFIYTVPEGRVFFFEYLNVVHNIDTTYYIWIDGVYQPTLSFALQDFGDHSQIYKPPKMAYNTVEVWCLNNWIAAQTYATFFRGFNRWYRAIHREVTYESLKKQEQET